MATRLRAPRADAANNRERLIAAALPLLVADQHATMSEIAAAADVGRVTLYNHFATREALVNEVFQRQLAAAEAAFALDDPARPPAERLAGCIAVSWRGVANIVALTAAVAAEIGPERMRDGHERLFRSVMAIITAGTTNGSFRSELPARWLAEVYFDLVHGAALRARRDPEPDELIVSRLTRTMLAVVEFDGSGGRPAGG